MQIGFDFGGSLIKLSISYTKNNFNEEILKLIKDKVTHQFNQGVRHYINVLFKREEFDAFIELLKSIKPYLTQPFVVCTGGGVHDKRIQLQDALNDIEIEPLAEFKSIVDGVGYFAKIILDFIYTLNESLDKVNINFETLHPFLLVNIGTGISINRVNKEGSNYLCGTSMGGTSLLGFARFFDKNTNFEELLDNINKNYLINEEWIFEGMYENLMDEKPLSPLVPSIFQGIISNICSIAYLLAKKQKITYVMFIGNFMKGNYLARKKIKQELEKYSNHYGFNVYVM